MVNNMYDLHEVTVRWQIKNPDTQKSRHCYTFHLCVGEQVAKDFKELLVDLNVYGIREYAKACSIPLKEGEEISIIDTECHAIGSLGFIRDTDISELRNKFIIHKTE